VAATVALGVVGCTRDDVADAPVTVATTPTSVPATVAPTTTAAPAPTTAATSTPPISATTPPSTVAPPTTEPDVDAGVPGLDSDDAFCSAWSRFGGSWQVVLTASAFAPDPNDASRLEALASTVVADSYEAMFAAWPAELDSEEAVVADGYFGAFQRRSADALAALSEAGADAADIDRLAEVWGDALARRSPSDPVLAVDVPADLAGVVAAATDDFAAQRPPFTQDPTMVITVETPLTDQFLASACPDQGSIAGGDVTG